MSQNPRCLYNNSFAAFLRDSTMSILGALCNNYHGEARTTTREAWKAEIDIMQEVLSQCGDQDGHIVFEYRINKGLHIPAEICTFHKFAYDIVKRFSSEPPEVNLSSYKIVFDMLEKAVFHNKSLMRNLVLFMGYYDELYRAI